MAESAAFEARWRAWEQVCSALARWVDPSRSAASGPAWSSAPPEAGAFVALASAHLVAPALGAALRGDDDVPAPVRDYCEAALQLNEARNQQMLEGVCDALHALAAAGLATPVALKGVASLATGLYRLAGMRVLRDVDLLVPAHEAQPAVRALQAAGFKMVARPRRLVSTPHHDLPHLLHPRLPAAIELHRAVAGRPYDRVLPAPDVLARAVPVQLGGVALLAPDPTDAVLHNIVHDQLQDGAYHRRAAELRQLLELALLARRWADAIDWRRIEEALQRIGYRRVLEVARGAAGLLGAPASALEMQRARAWLRDGMRRPRALYVQGYAARMLARPQLIPTLLEPGRVWPRVRKAVALLR